MKILKDPYNPDKAFLLASNGMVFALSYICNVDEIYVTLLSEEDAEEVLELGIEVADIGGVSINEIANKVREVMGWRPCMKQ